MKLKEFLKPTGVKIKFAIALLLLQYIRVFISLSHIGCVTGCVLNEEKGMWDCHSCGKGSMLQILIPLIISYPLSCLLVFCYNKIKSKRVKIFLGLLFWLIILDIFLLFFFTSIY